VDRDRPRGDPGSHEVVLDLLVDRADDDDPQGVDGIPGQRDERRQGDGEVRADRRDELGHNPGPDGQRQPERHVEHEQRHPGHERCDHREHEAGQDVAARLLHRDAPDGGDDALLPRREPAGDGVPQRRPLRGHVVAEEQEREELEDDPHDRGHDAEDTRRQGPGEVLEPVG
jgi:hypothetical protein